MQVRAFERYISLIFSLFGIFIDDKISIMIINKKIGIKRFL